MSFSIDGYEPEGDAAVEAAGNDAPPPGSRYTIVTYTATNTGTEAWNVAFVRLMLATSDDEVIDERVALLDDEMYGELAPGESATGSRVFLVPDGTDVLISVSPGLSTETAYYFSP